MLESQRGEEGRKQVPTRKADRRRGAGGQGLVASRRSRSQRRICTPLKLALQC